MRFRFLKTGKRGKQRSERAEKHSTRGARKPVSGLVPRLLLAATFIGAGLVLLPPARPANDVLFRAGDVADREVIAPFNFRVPLSAEELKMQRAKAATTILPVYERQRDVEQDLTANLASVLDTVTSITSAGSTGVDERVARVGQWLPNLSRATLKAVVAGSGFRALSVELREYQRSVFARGLIDNAALIRRNNYRELTVVDGDKEQTRAVVAVLEQGSLDHTIREEAITRFGSDRESAQVFFEMVRGYLLPNLTFNVDETNRRRDASSATVNDYFEVSKNQRIIGKHDKVTREQEHILRSLEATRASQEAGRSPLAMLALYVSEGLRLALFCVLLGGYLFVFRRETFHRVGELGAVYAVVLLYLVFIAVVVRFGLNEYLIPAAFVSVILSALFDMQLGLVVSVFAAVLVALVAPFDIDVAFPLFVSAVAGVIGMEKMRSRSHVYTVFLHVGVGCTLGVVAMRLGGESGLPGIVQDAMWAFAGGIFCSATVMFLLPVFESLFGRTSRFTLLELTDLNKPILKRLNMEAHGTYHHSMMLGSLVDAVAESIGADPLRARVMAYYHDIGKMFKPEYFTENQEAGFNKHEKITPQMSALILVSHVKDGVELAREEKLPELIIDGIREHHGTTVMAFFYQKALETDSHSSVNRDDFRYPGPRPATKEAGLLMCADSVEAAVRSLKDPTPANIRNMVTRLIDRRAQDGELDDSGLTLRDLGAIKEKFVSILTGIYHKRIAYPGQDDDHPAAGEGDEEPGNESFG